jgi:hypothetical protein
MTKRRGESINRLGIRRKAGQTQEGYVTKGAVYPWVLKNWDQKENNSKPPRLNHPSPSNHAHIVPPTLSGCVNVKSSPTPSIITSLDLLLVK